MTVFRTTFNAPNGTEPDGSTHYDEVRFPTDADIVSLKSYAKAGTSAEILPGDNVQVAIAKLEKRTEETEMSVSDLVSSLDGKTFGVLPHLTITAPTGATVTAINDETEVEAVELKVGPVGVYQCSLPHLGDWTVSTTKEGHTGSRTVSVSEVKDYKVRTSNGYRYGIKIKKGEGSPANRVEYIYDAAGMTPAHMDFTRGIFDYGDWEDVFFVKDNKPCMVRSDGTVGYYLDPDNYDKKEDGTASDVSSSSYDGNAMSEFPLIWVYRYEDSEYQYEIVSDVQYDENYKAYAHTRADGSIAEHMYYSMFGGSGSATKIRSLAGQSLAQSLTAQQEITGATANGSGWYTHSWSQRELIRTLLTIMGKSTNTQAVFGNGNCHQSASSASALLATGTLKGMGQFYGYNDSTHQVKVFHIEGFWGDQWDRVAGLINNSGTIYAKMTPEGTGYRITDVTGYTNTGISAPSGSQAYISATSCSEFGMIPTAVSGSATTYFCDGYWANNSQLDYLLVGACAAPAVGFGGGFAFAVDYPPAAAVWYYGCGLSLLEPAAA